MADPVYYDELETRPPEEREGMLFAALAKQVANAKANAPAYAELLGEVDPATICNRKALADLPVIRKSDLIALQTERPPFGGFACPQSGTLARVFASPGPIFEPETTREDYWRVARALFAAGFRAGDLIHNSYSYHFTPAGFILESGARALGCTVFPAGTGQTELQVNAMSTLRPNGYVGTPSFLKVICEKASELDIDISSVRKACVSGEALPASLRRELLAFGIEVVQVYATADLGLIAYESPAQEGLILDEGLIMEIVTPGTGNAVSDGQVGEIVITTLNPDYPLLRFATGDLSAVLPGVSPCGRTNVRIKGWMGRADQSTKIKGLFVRPEQIAEVVRRHPDILRARLQVTSENNYDVMTLLCEVSKPEKGFEATVELTVQDLCKLRGLVRIVAPGTLPNDGKVIDDQRSYE